MGRTGHWSRVIGAVTAGVVCAAAVAQAAWSFQPSEQPEQRAVAKSKKNKEGSTPEPAQVPATRTGGRVSPEAILKAFQQQRPTNTPVRSKRSIESKLSDGTTTGPNVVRLHREGEYISDAVGRLERDGSWWTFVFESDSPEAPQPPMRLLPNQKLENMARAQGASSESIVFEVSGEVTLFASRNYLLVRKSLRRRSAENLQK